MDHRRGIWLTLLGVAALAAVVALVPPLREAVASVLSGDAGRLRSELRDLGAGGALVLAGLMLVHAVVPFPSELLNAAAGFVYGFWLALPLVLAGWLLSALATYAIGRGAGAAAAAAARGGGAAGGGLAADRARRPDRRCSPRGSIPIVPYSLVGYVAGAAQVPLWRFAWTTVVGSIPLCAAVVYLGEPARLAVGHRPRRAGRGRLVPRAADRRPRARRAGAQAPAPLRRRVGSAACCAASSSSPPRSSSSTRCSSRRSSRCCRVTPRSSTSARPAPGSSRPPIRPGRCSARCPAAGSRRGWACARPSSSASRC